RCSGLGRPATRNTTAPEILHLRHSIGYSLCFSHHSPGSESDYWLGGSGNGFGPDGSGTVPSSSPRRAVPKCRQLWLLRGRKDYWLRQPLDDFWRRGDDGSAHAGVDPPAFRPTKLETISVAGGHCDMGCYCSGHDSLYFPPRSAARN